MSEAARPDDGDPHLLEDATSPAKSADPFARDPEAAGVPDAYELKINDSDGNPVDVDPALLGDAAPVCKELGLTNEQASKLGDLYTNRVLPKAIEQHQEQQVAGLVAQSQAWREQVLADAELSAAVADARAFLEADGDPELRQFLRESALGNHPLLVKLLAKAQRLASGRHSKAKDDGERFYGRR